MIAQSPTVGTRLTREAFADSGGEKNSKFHILSFTTPFSQFRSYDGMTICRRVRLGWWGRVAQLANLNVRSLFQNPARA